MSIFIITDIIFQDGLVYLVLKRWLIVAGPGPEKTFDVADADTEVEE
jgi:hypothetical protein